MEILRKPIYRCDICGKEGEWITGKWIAHVFLLNAMKGHEHEFHVCGYPCDNKLVAMRRQERIKLADSLRCL